MRIRKLLSIRKTGKVFLNFPHPPVVVVVFALGKKVYIICELNTDKWVEGRGNNLSWKVKQNSVGEIL